MTDPARPDVDALKSCPFCGSAPKCNGFPSGTMGQIYCDGAECFGPRTTALTKQDSIIQWNTRATPASSEAAERAGTNLAEYHNWAEYLRKVVAPKCDPFDRGELLKIADFIAAPPQPARDAMREALKACRPLVESFRWQGKRYQVLLAQIDAALSAPVPSPDGVLCSKCGITLASDETCASVGCPIQGDNRASGAGAAEPVAWRNRVKFLKVDGTWRDDAGIEAVLDEFLSAIESLYAVPPVRGDRSIMADQYADYSVACDQVRREMRALILERDDPKLSSLYYRSVTLSEHEAARRTLLTLSVQAGVGGREAVIKGAD